MDGKIGLTIVLLIAVGVVGCAKNANKSEDSETLLATGASAMPPDPEYQKAAMVNVELGLGYLAQGQVARAKNKLTHAVKLAPNAAEPHSAMAYFLEKVGSEKDSEREHKKALKLGNGKGAVFNNYGAFLCRQGRLEEADSAFQRALLDKEYARTAEVYENAGVCALKGTDLHAADHYLKTALKQDPKRSNALLELASLKLRQKEWGEAKTLLGQYKQISEPTARSLWLGLQLSDQIDDKDGVASQALLLKNLYEDSPEYQFFLKSEIGKT